MALDPRSRPGTPNRRLSTVTPSPSNATVDNFVPHPVLLGSGLFLLGLLITALLAGGETPTDIARSGAIGCGLSLLVSVAVDARLGMRNLVRADLLALVSLYYLTFCEFLLPQTEFAWMVEGPATLKAVRACLFGFAGLVVGRHLINPRRQPFSGLLRQPISTRQILTVFWACFLIGFSYML